MGGKAGWILVAVLAAQGLVFLAISRSEAAPAARPLSEFPAQIGEWQLAQEGVVDAATQAVLRADDLLNRTYVGVARVPASLFVAFFRSQRAGKAPHSPKNCLPGNGWVQERADTVTIPIQSEGRSISVNQYVVAKGDSRSLVLYWYQSRDRVVASEYTAKIHVVVDAIRFNRTDTSLVRVVVPLAGGAELDSTTKLMQEFIQAIFPTLRAFLPA